MGREWTERDLQKGAALIGISHLKEQKVVGFEVTVVWKT